MPRLSILLTVDEGDRLGELARAERRTPQDQASLLVARALTPTDGIGPGRLSPLEAVAEVERLARECVEDGDTTDSRLTDALFLVAAILRHLDGR